MASDDNDPRRNRDPYNDNNPFIAFRRFADSQVSSLLNTVFTLPATIANYRNAHVAREQCLFGRADKEKCRELHELEEETNTLLEECRRLFRAGDVEEAFAKGENLLHLNESAEMLRKQILENSKEHTSFPSDYREGVAKQAGLPEAARLGMSRWTNTNPEARECSSRNELVEKVANEKGQQWGWSWDWGFPRPFDAEEDPLTRRDRCLQWHRRREESTSTAKQLGQDSGTSGTSRTLEEEQWQRRFWQHCDELTPENRDAMLQSHMLQNYRSAALEAARAGVPRDAFEDLIRTQNGLPLMPSEQLGQSDHLPLDRWTRRLWDQRDRHFAGRPHANQYPKRVPWEGEETAEEPSYEYSHDHEDQHDEPPSPKANQGNWSEGMPEIELEAYERLLGHVPTPGNLHQAEARPSVLSTLTTTERTVAPDGTVTTKVVLKKRFTDGREESSETVCTQRGQEEERQRGDRLPMSMDTFTQNRAQEQEEHRKEDNKKRSGWFWSK